MTRPIFGGMITDTFKLFFSDHTVMGAIIAAIAVVGLLIVAINFLRRW